MKLVDLRLLGDAFEDKTVASNGEKISEDSTKVNVAETAWRKKQQQRLYPCDHCEQITNHTAEDHHFGLAPPPGNNKTKFKNKEAFKPKYVKKNTGKEKKTCYLCNKVGHLVANCPKRQDGSNGEDGGAYSMELYPMEISRDNDNGAANPTTLFDLRGDACE